jgi:chemotaxis protein methyltransferase CheR
MKIGSRRIALAVDAVVGLLADVLRRRLGVGRDAPDAYLARLETESFNRDEAGALSQELTVPETYFFRNNDQYRAFADVALPDRMRAQAAARRLRILSAGCADVGQRAGRARARGTGVSRRSRTPRLC